MFGQTEATAVVFHSLPDDDLYHSTATVGYIGNHIEIKVIDEKGNLVPFGKPGELCIRGYVNMLGYWDDEEKTKETISADGWLKTGYYLKKNRKYRVVDLIFKLFLFQ